jgi:hypothetical protein
MDESLAKRVNLADGVLDALEALIRTTRPLKGGAGRLRIVLFCTMVEQFRASLVLIRNHLGSHIAVHGRGMFEALVSMRLLENERHVDQMAFKDASETQKFLAAILGDDGLPWGADQAVPLQNKLANATARVEALAAEGFKKVQMVTQIKDAKLGPLAAMYHHLCGYSHNQLTVLAARHQGEQGLQYMIGEPPESTEAILIIELQILANAIHELTDAALFDAGAVQNLDEALKAAVPAPE